ncbi:MAG: pyridoxal 5'-phosphate synthase glutaminase subunit PdxT [Acidimicrobiales bacterium]|nr:pyridoxal 5'-phosphate synthase glutaminase subunit PdxT [Acidimicrobiales bacterium]
MKVGVLALQGAFASHAAMLGEAGATPVEVRRAHELAEVDALVMPGGESTTMSMLLDIAELREPLAGRLADGMPVFGTCAGMILLAVEVLDGRSDQRSMGAIDLDVRRNGYGRQVDSFETELAIEGFDDAFHGVFIRSPVVERIGPDVEVLAEVEGRPVLCRQGNVLVASFHPELAGDVRIHRRFLEAAFASDAT